jgi:hypothetical protein
MWLSVAFHAILELAVAFREFLGDNIRTSRNVQEKGRGKKHSLTNPEFVG